MKLFSFTQETDLSDEEAAVKPRGASRDRREVASESEERSNALESDRWWQPFWTFSALLIFIGVLWSLGDHLWRWLDRPVSEIEVVGTTQHLDKRALAADIAAGLDDELLDVDIASIQQLVSEHPWVRVSAIKRDWPAKLRVMIEEEVPVARWGERGLLNHQGDIFWPELKDEYRTLPRLSGPSPDTERVMSQFHDLNQMFRPAGLSVVSLDLEPRGAWQIVLDNNIRLIVGRESVNQRLQRFLVLYQSKLSQRADEIEQIDIRYTHGVAVKWREKTDDENAG
ncbi:cell division protein FtsQ/DivIB [uncultured Neptuniibacter sp.]|uniref:cell division protein FtsQ/DivIB n=1 Tax=uncultured Neptuniibacter sp. TaxID=502143 RepID=UPI00261793FD|nr:cell division protein FtsQ/DivIB [uncultured Neptuniibacter sp.]